MNFPLVRCVGAAATFLWIRVYFILFWLSSIKSTGFVLSGNLFDFFCTTFKLCDPIASLRSGEQTWAQLFVWCDHWRWGGRVRTAAAWCCGSETLWLSELSLLQISTRGQTHKQKCHCVPFLQHQASVLTDIVFAFPCCVFSEWLLYGTYNMLTSSLWGEWGLLLWSRKWPARTPGDLRGKAMTLDWPLCLPRAQTGIEVGQLPLWVGDRWVVF